MFCYNNKNRITLQILVVIRFGKLTGQGPISNPRPEHTTGNHHNYNHPIHKHLEFCHTRTQLEHTRKKRTIICLVNLIFVHPMKVELHMAYNSLFVPANHVQSMKSEPRIVLGTWECLIDHTLGKQWPTPYLYLTLCL